MEIPQPEVHYAIGIAKPVSVMIDTFGTSKIALADIAKIVTDIFNKTISGW